ncbi:hypothetical protein [Streptomyces sp. NPDC059491]
MIKNLVRGATALCLALSPLAPPSAAAATAPAAAQVLTSLTPST